MGVADAMVRVCGVRDAVLAGEATHLGREGVWKCACWGEIRKARREETVLAVDENRERKLRDIVVQEKAIMDVQNLPGRDGRLEGGLSLYLLGDSVQQ